MSFSNRLASFAALLLIANLSCHRTPAPVMRSFYYWQSNFHLSDAESRTIDTLGIEKLYVKFFDVTWDATVHQPVPVATIWFDDVFPDNTELVPVVFIANQSLEKISLEDCKTLAYKIAKKLDVLLQQFSFTNSKEIQLDCDWTDGTRDKYFALIEEMKKYPAFADIAWSATIRLHQIKFSETTGVPPVDRGMLMFYNMGDIEEVKADNSIFDAHTAEQYSPYLKSYKLPLDAAIACFSWGLLFEGEKLLKIYYPLYAGDLESDSNFTKQAGNIFTANNSFYFNGYFLNAGDRIRLETMTPEKSEEAAKLLSSNLKNEPRTVILYHLDSVITNTYTYEDFRKIFDSFY